MKKTLTVNLGGTVYHIDEDAYRLLDNYLNNLRYHFRKEEGAEEMVRDIEVRIAEIFDEYIRAGQQVVTLENVEEVIARMGKPEDWEMDEPRPDTASAAPHAKDSGSRRLFRNPDDRILGGVLSGLSDYFGLDVTWVRLGVLFLGFFVHFLILAYLIAWIVIPAARTATEKLQMKGQPINVENIGKTVTDGFEKMNHYVHSEKPRSVLAQLGDAIVQIAGFVIKFLLVVLAICCTPVLLVIFVVLFAMLMMATGLIATVPAFFYYIEPEINWEVVNSVPGASVGFALCGLLAVGIPMVGLLQIIMQSFKVWRPMSTTAKVVLTVLWIMSVLAGVFFFFNLPCYALIDL